MMGIFSKRKKEVPSEKNERPSEASERKETQPERPPGLAARPIGTELIRWPLLTEKATDLQTRNKYVFVVAKRAGKSEIKKEVARLFGVKVEKVSIINEKSKRRLWRGREGRRAGYKKAIVTIEAGKKIEILPT